jgi:CDP-diacylglycerol--inositol 3-phosphatidyltransferase
MVNPVYFWYPNLVGYGRIVATVLAFSCVFADPQKAAFFYLVGQGLDAVDGVTARYFNQCSKFGAVLDMLTDRMSTAVLLIVLSILYPAHWGLFAFLIVLDIVSHWFQMYSKLVMNKTSHKGSKNPLLNFYYTFPYALLVFCVGNEFFFVCLYLLASPSLVSSYLGLLNAILYTCFPIFFMKQFMNVVQLYDSIGDVVELDCPQTNK